MSHLWAPSTEQRSEPCEECGTTVTREKMTSLYTGKVWWRTPGHDAPCGLPCLSGGVRPKAYRAGEFHAPGRCPRCDAGATS